MRQATGKSESEGQGLGSKIASGLKKGLVVGGAAVVGAAVGAIGVSLVKGFQRLEGIDNARQKLTGLGHDAGSVDAIMNNALASVRGTAFGMADAATVAASATAAGIKPGEDLERTLKLVADAATIAGTDMGSMGAIFNKAAASNKVQMDVINQLHDAGVPALSALADHMGVTAEEASKMASEGKIDFETFQAAMESTLGGAAASSGATFSGAMANVMASLGRIGAGLLEGVFPHLAPLMQAITTSLGPLEDVASAIGDKIGSVVGPAIQWLIDLLSGSGDMGMFGQIAAQVFDLWTQISPLSILLQTVFPAVVEAAAPLIDMLGATLPGIISQLAPIVTMLADAAGTILVAAFEAIAPLLPVIAEVLVAIVTAAMPLVDVIMTLVEAFAPLLPVIGDLIGALLPPLLDLLMSLLMPILELVAPLLDLLVPALQFLADVIGVVVGAVVWLLEALVGLITGNEETGGRLKGVWEAIKSFFIGIGDWWSSLWQSVTSFATNAWQGLLNFFRGIPGWIGGIFAAAGQWLLNAGSNIVNGLRTGVTNMWNNFIGFLRGLPGQIINFFAGAGQWLWSAGQNIVQGLLNGVRSLAGSIGNFFLDLLPGWIVGPFKAALGIASPSKLFAQYGVNIGEGVLVGLDDVQPAIDSRMRSLVEVPAGAAGGPGRGVNGQRGVVKTEVKIYGNVGWMPDELAREMDERQRQALALAGVDDIVGVA